MIEQKTVSEFLQTNTTGFIIFDVRDKENYDEGHIKGAMSVPLVQIDKSCLIGIDNLAVLCGGGSKAGRAIEKIVGLGFTGRIVHLVDGTRGAVANGIELEK